MWNKESEGYQAFAPQWEPLAEEINNADSFVIITPEWAGMTTPAIKNFFLYANASLIGNKPCMLVSVSAGRGGRYPIAEMRMSSYKNSQCCYIPQHVIVDHVNDVLNDYLLTATEKPDLFIKERIQYSLTVLREY
jgi:NAD(P)H-dependent FMN reductase